MLFPDLMTELAKCINQAILQQILAYFGWFFEYDRENYLGYKLPLHLPWPRSSCFENFRGTAVRQVPSIDHLNLSLVKMPLSLSIFSQKDYFDPCCLYKFAYWMTNSADPDQLASSEANWSGSTLFSKAGYIWVQHDKGLNKKVGGCRTLIL